MFLDSIFITKSRKLKIIFGIIDIITRKYKANLIDIKTKEDFSSSRRSISVDIFVSNISINNTVQMNIDLADELALQNLAGITIIPIFILIEAENPKNSTKETYVSEEETHVCHQ